MPGSYRFTKFYDDEVKSKEVKKSSQNVVRKLNFVSVIFISISCHHGISSPGIRVETGEKE